MRILSAVTLACALAVLGAGQARAVDCDTAITQIDMTTCAVEDYAAADADMNDAYAEARAAMRRMDLASAPGQRGAEGALREAQRAWIPFRDAACVAEGFQMRGGSAETMLVYFCLSRLTQQRAQDLWDMAEGPEG